LALKARQTCSIPTNVIIKDFLSKELGPKDRTVVFGIPFSGLKQASYMGAAEIPVKAHLGVDLQKVQIKIDPGGRLIVGGLSMSTTADTGRGTQWRIHEIRTSTFENDKVTEVQIDPTNDRLMEERDEHETQLRERISAGQCFTVFEKPLLKAAGEVLRSLLSPLEREIVFVETPPSDATPLLDFLACEQKRIAQRRRELDGPASSPAKANQ